MTKQQRKKHASRGWLFPTVMMSVGLAALIAAIGFIALNAVDVPSFNSEPAQAAFNSPVNVVGSAASTASPLLTSLSSPEATPAQTQTTISAPSPLPSSTPTETPLPMATARRKIKPLPIATLRLAARPVTAGSVVAGTPTTMPTSVARTLDFSFYIRSVTCASEASRLIVDVMITAHGGQPPYDYYNDTTVIGQSIDGSILLTVKAAIGNPIPFKLIVVDSAGARYSETFFWRSKVRCS